MQPSSLHYTLAHMNYVLITTWEAFKLHPQQSPIILSRRLISSPSPHQTLTSTTNIVSLVLKNQIYKNQTILDR